MTEKEASQNSKLLYEVKLYQEVLYQQETKKIHCAYYTHFKHYCKLTCSHLQLFQGTVVLHMVFIFTLHMQDALFYIP